MGGDIINKYLLNIMQKKDYKDILPEIFKAIGECGDKYAVLPLEQFVKGIMFNMDLEKPALLALEKIRTRLGNVDNGMLSMSGENNGEEGSLSINHGETSGLLSMKKSKETGPDSGLEE